MGVKKCNSVKKEKKEGRRSLEASRRFRLSLTEAPTLWEYGVLFP